MLNTTVKMPISTMSEVVPSATATRNAIAVLRNEPTYGMNPAKNPSTAIGSASGRPRMTMISPLVIPPNAEITAVPSM